MKRRVLAVVISAIISLQGILPCTVMAELETEETAVFEEDVLSEETQEEIFLSDEDDFSEVTEEVLDNGDADIDEFADAEITDEDGGLEEFVDADVPEEAADEEVSSEFSDDAGLEEVILEEPAAEEENSDAEPAESQDNTDEEIGLVDPDGEDEPELVGADSLMTQSHNKLKNYLTSHGSSVTERDPSNSSNSWTISFSSNKFRFRYETYFYYSGKKVTQSITLDVPYLFSSAPTAVYSHVYDGTVFNEAKYTLSNYAGYNGNQTLNFNSTKVASNSSAPEVKNMANTYLSSAYTWWDRFLMEHAGTSMKDFGFGRKQDVPVVQPKEPVLINAYNGARGIGIKFYKTANAKEYEIYRKYDGAWGKIRTISATSSELQISGNTIMYTDTTVAKNYGKGYIYSVAAKNGPAVSSYNKIGKAIYRLKPPTLKLKELSGGNITVSWSVIFRAGESNGHYDLQYTTYTNGKAGTFTSIAKLPGLNYLTLYATMAGFYKGTYVFRIRCSKTNKDRGTFYSEYSPWLKVEVK